MAKGPLVPISGYSLSCSSGSHGKYITEYMVDVMGMEKERISITPEGLLSKDF